MSDIPHEPCVVKTVLQEGQSTTCTLTLDLEHLSMRSLLIDGMQKLVDFLTEAQGTDREGAVVVDLRVSAARPASQPLIEGFLDACRAVLHSWVLENGAAVRPANAMVSLPPQSIARQQTREYFTSPRGQFSRGSFIDLRSVIR